MESPSGQPPWRGQLTLPTCEAEPAGPAGPAGSGRYLLVIEGDSSAICPLPETGVMVVGRTSQAGLRLRHPSVSRRHAKLVLTADNIEVSDLDSRNGTLVNSERIAGTRRVTPGDVVCVGDVVLVVQGMAAAATGQLGASRAPLRAEEVWQRVDEESAIERLDLGDGRSAIVADPAMLRIFELVRRLAASDLPVLIMGETGTGKENVAHALHHWSGVREHPLVAVNCAAIQETLVESELFGHEKGAFTGAVSSKPGLLETAAGGTIFLDEVGDLPLTVQAKLLRVLESKRLTRLGDVREREVAIRIVAATHHNLESDVESGRFRRDLFFRLSAASVCLPPLRDRRREIPLLARSFLDQACERMSRPPMTLSPAVMRVVLSYRWPGNVRELKHVMEYLAVAVVENEVLPHHLPHPLSDTATPDGGQIVAPAAAGPAAATVPPPPSGARPVAGGAATEARPAASAAPGLPAEVGGEAPGAGSRASESGGQQRPLDEELRELERARIVEALHTAGGVQTRAAKLLGMPRRTFVQRLKQYGLASPRRQEDD